MISIILLFLLSLFAVCLGIQLGYDPGYLLININHWSIESTLSVAIIALFLIFASIHMILLSFHWLTDLPQKYKNWRMIIKNVLLSLPIVSFKKSNKLSFQKLLKTFHKFPKVPVKSNWMKHVCYLFSCLPFTPANCQMPSP